MTSFIEIYQTINTQIGYLTRKIPIVKNIPGFNSIPANITNSNLRFYKLSNLVLTLGMFVHFFWIFLFYFIGSELMVLINIGSFLVYILATIINRKGYHFTSSTIMVVEIVLHQLIAIRYFGWDAGFQNYILAVSLIPFLMPRGLWGVKFLLLGLCVLTYIVSDFYIKTNTPYFLLGYIEGNFLRITNVIFAYISLGISGGYLTLATHETEDLLKKKSEELLSEKNKSDDLLLNILPFETAMELKTTGTTKSKKYDDVTVIFTDFKGFTETSELLTPEELVDEIHYCYSEFDRIIEKYGIEKIKTIGDAYMCAGGLPIPNKTHALDSVKACIEIRDFILKEKERRLIENKPFFEIRIGIHTGPVVAGIVGIKKFAYDIWGDTVNTASRMESMSETNKINISETTYLQIKDNFECTYRGKVDVKGKGGIDMYFVENQNKTNNEKNKQN